jgi:putative colanic acid biosynthesis acetyltransferase WcaF
LKRVSLKQFNNDWYYAGNKIKIIIWYFTNILFFKSSLPFPSKLKVNILRLFSAEIGDRVLIKPCVNIKYPWFLSIGSDVWIGENVWIDNLAYINIGNNVVISQGAYLLTGNHDYKKDTFDLIIGKITINEGAWVGAKAVVCPGVTLQEYSILTVGSVATKNLKNFGIYQGNPAIKIKQRVIV